MELLDDVQLGLWEELADLGLASAAAIGALPDRRLAEFGLDAVAVRRLRAALGAPGEGEERRLEIPGDGGGGGGGGDLEENGDDDEVDASKHGDSSDDGSNDATGANASDVDVAAPVCMGPRGVPSAGWGEEDKLTFAKAAAAAAAARLRGLSSSSSSSSSSSLGTLPSSTPAERGHIPMAGVVGGGESFGSTTSTSAASSLSALGRSSYGGGGSDGGSGSGAWGEEAVRGTSSQRAAQDAERMRLTEQALAEQLRLNTDLVARVERLHLQQQGASSGGRRVKRAPHAHVAGMCSIAQCFFQRTSVADQLI